MRISMKLYITNVTVVLYALSMRIITYAKLWICAIESTKILLNH